MTALGPQDFPVFFEAIHGYEPFPWQSRLAKLVIESGHWPKLLDLPTAAGKTAAIDIAIFHLAYEAAREELRRAPLRILFVIDRRIVVDAATKRAQKIMCALRRPKDKIASEVARRLSHLSGDKENPLNVVRLRGGAPQDRDWARSPAQPLVAVSTVDQVGSRLLFRGYGVSPRMWPVHAGLVGADTLWLLDEVHLSQPLEQTLEAIERSHPNGETNGGFALQPRLAPFSLVRLSATPGANKDEAFSLAEEDRRHPKMQPRLTARKVTTLVQVDGQLHNVLADHALRLCGLLVDPSIGKSKKKKASAADIAPQVWRVAVVVNRVDLARRTFEVLRERTKTVNDEVPKADIILLTGRVRPLDRERISDETKALLADPNRSPPDRPIILVATQTVEAGADIDVDALVTEVAPLDCLRQRFGRLDRLGLRQLNDAVIVHPKGVPTKDNDWATIGRIYGDAAYETKQWLSATGDALDFGIVAFEPILRSLEADPQRLAKMLALRQDAPALLPSYVDLWARTSPAPQATPEPALFLHGPGMSSDIQVIWRADVSVDDEESVARANVCLDLCPPSSLEALPIPLWTAQRWLCETNRDDDPIADVPERAPEIDRKAVERDPKRLLRQEDDVWKAIKPDQLKAGDVIVVPASYNGCDEYGWNPQYQEEVSDLGAEANYRQRRRGAVRVTKRTLINALKSKEAAAESWCRITVLLEESGDEIEEAPERLRAALADIETLPRTWLLLLNGMQDANVRVVPLKDDEFSAGFVIYSERRIASGLLDSAMTDHDEEPTGNEAVTAHDSQALFGVRIDLFDHLRRVERHARAFARAAGLSAHLVDLIGIAARLHDLGKADPRFQADLYDASSLARLGLLELTLGPLIAKSERRKSVRRIVRAAPENFRHEALSVALANQHPDVQKLSDDDRDFVLWLIGTHHGYGRPFFPPSLDPAPETPVDIPIEAASKRLYAQAQDAPLRLDQGWFELAARVIRRFGPWELARIEAILRLADHAASAEEENEKTTKQTVRESAEVVR